MVLHNIFLSLISFKFGDGDWYTFRTLFDFLISLHWRGQKTRKILTEKIQQLNSAIDTVYARLRAGRSSNGAAVTPDELEASIWYILFVFIENTISFTYSMTMIILKLSTLVIFL